MNEFVLRCLISCVIATVLYFVSAGVVSHFWGRKVARDTMRYDIRLGLISLLSGTPMLQVFAWSAEKYHFTKLYMSIGDYGWGYWFLSLPLYVLCWDFVFYLTHLVLHWPLVYRKSHFRHHSCRPPVPWSGVAIDPFETILSGIMNPRRKLLLLACSSPPSIRYTLPRPHTPHGQRLWPDTGKA